MMHRVILGREECEEPKEEMNFGVKASRVREAANQVLNAQMDTSAFETRFRANKSQRNSSIP